jgi:hypothetical protein
MFEKGEKVALKENPLITGTVILVRDGVPFISGSLVQWTRTGASSQGP